MKSAIVSENLHIAESSRSKGEKCEDEINNNVQTVVAKVPDDQKQLVKLKLNQSHKNASKRKALKKFPLPEQPKSSSESEEDSDVTVVDYSSPIRISEKESYARIDDIIAAVCIWSFGGNLICGERSSAHVYEQFLILVNHFLEPRKFSKVLNVIILQQKKLIFISHGTSASIYSTEMFARWAKKWCKN